MKTKLKTKCLLTDCKSWLWATNHKICETWQTSLFFSLFTFQASLIFTWSKMLQNIRTKTRWFHFSCPRRRLKRFPRLFQSQELGAHRQHVKAAVSGACGHMTRRALRPVMKQRGGRAAGWEHGDFNRWVCQRFINEEKLIRMSRLYRKLLFPQMTKCF